MARGETNRVSPDASFVYRNWLDAQGGVDTVRGPIIDWLAIETNRLNPDASFVYRGWLDAQGGVDTVRAAIVDWAAVESNRLSVDASFVYKSWLKAGGGFSLLRAPILEWVHAHIAQPETSHLLRFVAKQKDLADDAILDVLNWCQQFPETEDALWKLSWLKKTTRRESLAVNILEACEAVLTYQLKSAQLTRESRSMILTLLANLSVLPLTALGSAYDERLNSLIEKWIQHRDAIPHAADIQWFHEEPALLERALLCLERRPTRAGLRRLMNWVAGWDGHMEDARTVIHKAAVRAKLKSAADK